MASLRPVLEEMEAAAGGPGKWLAIYGGDPCGRKALLGVPSAAAADGADDGAFTIGDLMRAVKAEFSPALLAVSSAAELRRSVARRSIRRLTVICDNYGYSTAGTQL